MVCEIPLREKEMLFAIIDSSGAMTLAYDPERIIQKNERIVFSALVD